MARKKLHVQLISDMALAINYFALRPKLMLSVFAVEITAAVAALYWWAR